MNKRNLFDGVYLNTKNAYMYILMPLSVFVTCYPYMVVKFPVVFLFLLNIVKPLLIISLIYFLNDLDIKKIYIPFFIILFCWIEFVSRVNGVQGISEGQKYMLILVIVLAATSMKISPRIFITFLAYYFSSMILINTLLMRPGGTFLNSNGQISYFIGTKTTITYYQIVAIVLIELYGFLLVETEKWKAEILSFIIIVSLVVYNIRQPISASKLCLAIYILLLVVRKVNYKMFKLVVKYGFYIFLLLNILIVFFRIQYLFSYIIVDILDEDLTLDGRTYIWNEVMLYFLQSPIIGWGETIPFTFVSSINTSAHNQILGWLVHYGIIGTVYLMANCIYIISHKTDDNLQSIVRMGFTLFSAYWIVEQMINLQLFFLILVICFEADQIVNCKNEMLV